MEVLGSGLKVYLFLKKGFFIRVIFRVFKGDGYGFLECDESDLLSIYKNV